MTNDDFLTGLRADWRQPRVDLGRIKRLTERRRRRARLLQAVNLLGAAAAALLVLWFAYRAVEARDALPAVGAAAFLASLPLIMLEYLTSRRDLRVQYDDTPRGVLLQARHHAEMARRLLRSGRWAATILMASAA